MSTKTNPQTPDELDKLAQSLSDLRSPESLKEFLESFLSQSEQETLGKRLEIIWLLAEGRSYEEIIDQLKVSSATISSISGRLDEPGIQKMIDRLRLDKRLRQLVGL